MSRACALLHLARDFRYLTQPKDDTVLRDQLRELAARYLRADMSDITHVSHAENSGQQIAPEILCAPHTGYDPSNQGQWPCLDSATRAALEICVCGTSWENQLLLAAVILAACQWPMWQILSTLCALHGHLLRVFHAGGFSEIGAWDVQSQYDDDLWSNHWTGRERERRIAFWELYQDVVRQSRQWLEQLSFAEQQRYQCLLLPALKLH